MSVSLWFYIFIANEFRKRLHSINTRGGATPTAMTYKQRLMNKYGSTPKMFNVSPKIRNSPKIKKF